MREQETHYELYSYNPDIDLKNSEEIDDAILSWWVVFLGLLKKPVTKIKTLVTFNRR